MENLHSYLETKTGLICLFNMMIIKLTVISIIIVALTILLLGFKFFNMKKYHSCTRAHDSSVDKNDQYECICGMQDLKRNDSK